MRKSMASFSLIFLAFLLWIPPLVRAQGAVTLEAQAGFDGYCKSGHWLPIRVTLENQGMDLTGRLEVSVGYATQTTTYAQPVDLPGVSRKETFLYVYPEDTTNHALTVNFVSGGKVLADSKLNVTCVRGDEALVALIAETPSAFSGLRLGRYGGRPVTAQLQPGDLPDQSAALRALDVLVISGVDTGLFRPAQIQAIQQWVAGGGQLLVTGGPSWQKTASALRDLLPLLPDGSTTLPDLNALADYSPNSPPLDGQALISQGELAPAGRRILSQSGHPLIVSRTVGSGSVVYLTFDPSLAPFRSWPGADFFFAHLFAGQGSLPAWYSGFQAWDMAANAISSLPSLRLPNIALVLGFLGFYVLAVGPLNYVLVRVLKRRELAWATIPALVIVFSLLAYLVGLQGRGNRPTLSRLAVIQSWPGVALAQVDALAGIYSPQRAAYQLQTGPDLLVHPLPAINSPNLRPSNPLILHTPQQGSSLPQMRLDVAGLQAVAIEGQVPALPFESQLNLSLAGNQVSLQGSYTNNSQVTLHDAVLLVPGKAVSQGQVSPGEKRQIQLQLPALGQAEPAASAGAFASGSPGIYYGAPFGGPNNDLFSSMLGTSNYYQNQSTYMRYNLLSAIVGYGGSAGGRGGGIYLAGWSDESPLDISLEGRKFQTNDRTLYLIALNTRLDTSGASITLPPSLFTWSPLEQSAPYNAGPYDLSLNSANYTFRFDLAQPIPYQSVESLVLHLESYNSNDPLNFEVSLWDFQSSAWIKQDRIVWGSNSISDPQRYVDAGGQVRLRLDNTGKGGGVTLSAADFILVVNLEPENP